MNSDQHLKFITSRRRPLLFGIAILGLWMVTTTQLMAQETTASLRGRVTELNNPSVPVEFATVQVLPQGAATATNSRGEFFFDKLSPGG